MLKNLKIGIVFGVAILLFLCGLTSVLVLLRRKPTENTPLYHEGEVDCQDKDPNNTMCPTCVFPLTPENTPCTGVVGAAQPAQGVEGGECQEGEDPPCFDPTDPIHAYGNFTISQRLQMTDLNRCATRGALGFSDANGHCVLGKGPNGALDNNRKRGKTSSLVLNDMSGNPRTHPLQAMHKVWGGGAAYPCENNNGVSKELLYVPRSPEWVNMPGGSRVKQRVIYMEMHGDLYRGDVPGVAKSRNSHAGDWPSCAKVSLSEADGRTITRRVGSIAATRDQYGPGTYNALCYIPKTEKVVIEEDDPRLTEAQKEAGWGSERKTAGVDDGRGYCFALWTYHAAEVYQKMNDKTVSKHQDPQFRKYADFPCYGQCDGGANDGMTCPNPGRSGFGVGESNCGMYHSNIGNYMVEDTFSSITHEIDIEYPHNSPGADWKESMTWDTINCNTWVSDINNYDKDTGSHYTQIAVKKDPAPVVVKNEEVLARKVFPEGFDGSTLVLSKSGWGVAPTVGPEYVIAAGRQSDDMGVAALTSEDPANYTFSVKGLDLESGFCTPAPGTAIWVKIQKTTEIPEPDYVSKEPESSTQKDYTWHTIDWYVDPGGDVSKNYVAFYFNSPFDPTGVTRGPDGVLLPKAPARKAEHITRRFVPTRSSRYNIGPWLAWWGFRDNDKWKHLTPLFDTAICRMAHLSIIPQPGFDPVDFPQNYDQEGVECDFQDMAENPPDPVDPDAQFKADAFPDWRDDLDSVCKYSRKMDGGD